MADASATPAGNEGAAPAPAVEIEPHLKSTGLRSEYERLVRARESEAPPDSQAKPTENEPAVAGSADEQKPAAPVDAKPEGAPEGTKDPDAAERERQEAFDALLRKSNAIRKREKELKAREAEVEALRTFKQRIESKDYDALTEAGLSLDEWGQKYLEKDGKEDPREKELRELRESVTSLTERLENRSKEEEQEKKSRAEQEAQQRISSFKKEIDDHLASSEEFKALSVAGLGHEVYNVIAQHAQRTQEATGTARILDISEAAKAVKKYYDPKLKEQIKSLLALPEYRSVLDELQPKPPAEGGNEPAAEAPQQGQEGQPARTATTLNSRLNGAPPRGEQPMSLEERRQQAISMLKFV